MFDRRCRGYEALGYTIELPPGAAAGWPVGVPLPVEPAWRETYSESIRRLCRDGVDAELADLFVWASRQTSGAVPADAKAAALRFLSHRLETLPTTAGRFAANVRLPIAFGGNPFMDVDLFDTTDRLAILLDDAASLCNPDSYRRARRQEFLLQRAGYRFLRILIADVPVRLPGLLDDILQFALPSA